VESTVGTVFRYSRPARSRGVRGLPYFEAARHLVAAEPDPAMRRRMAGKLSAARVPVEVVDAAAEELPFPEGSFDAVVSQPQYGRGDRARGFRVRAARALRPLSAPGADQTDGRGRRPPCLTLPRREAARSDADVERVPPGAAAAQTPLACARGKS